MPDNHDPVTLTLSALRTDAEHIPLADSRSVRRRGDRRTRNQAVGGALAVVGLVVGAAGLVGGLDGDRRATEIPATPAPTVTPTPTVTQESLAAQPFLLAEDLGGFGGYDQAGPFIDAGQEPDILPEQCATRPGGWEAAQISSTRYYQDGSEAEIREYVLRFGDVGSAEQAALKRAYSDLTASSCPATVDPSEGTLTTRESYRVPGLDGAVRHSRYFYPEVASEPNYYEVATAHRATVVVVLEWQGSGNPTGDGTEDWVWDADRLQAALDRAVD